MQEASKGAGLGLQDGLTAAKRGERCGWPKKGGAFGGFKRLLYVDNLWRCVPKVA